MSSISGARSFEASGDWGQCAGSRMKRGYGRIRADDGEVLFFHFTSIVGEGYRSAEAGQRVSFVWNGGIQDHGRHRAEDVRFQSATG